VKNYQRFTLLLGFILFSSAIFASQPNSPASIKRLIETRTGKLACWGVIVHLKKLEFNKSIADSEFSIIEVKHSADLKNIMIWSVDKTRNNFIIKFKKGCGDFGTGNGVEVKIKPSAISGQLKKAILLSISTDI
jgi:hypothetical protein